MLILPSFKSHTWYKEKEKIVGAEWGGKIWFDHGESNARGVCILARRGLDIHVHKISKSQNGRWLIASIKVDDRNILLCNIYAPNEDNPLFFINLFQEISKEEKNYDCTIIGGDLNVALDPQLDHKSMKRVNKKPRLRLRK